MAVERSSQEVHPSSLVPEYRPFQRSDVCLLHARQLCSNDFTLHNVTICGLAESQLPLRYENELSAERVVLLVDEKTSGSGLYVLHMARDGTPCKVATTDALGSSSAPIHVFSRPEFTEPLRQMGKEYDRIRRWTQNAWHEQACTAVCLCDPQPIPRPFQHPHPLHSPLYSPLYSPPYSPL